MSKKQRFPSPANVEVTKDGKVAQKPIEKEKPQPIVTGKSSKVVPVHNNGVNHVVLPYTAHHVISPGLNQVPDKIWEKAKDHPTIKAMLSSKRLVEVLPDPILPVGKSNELIDQEMEP